MDILIKNIKSLVHTADISRAMYKGSEMDAVNIIDDAYLFINGENISSFGKSQIDVIEDIRKKNSPLTEIDATGKVVLPSWCDSHTHIVYAGSREMEFVDRIRGVSYEEIAMRGGGILNSATRLRKATEEELFDDASKRLKEILISGTGAVEIKSGYGLDVASELKMLRVIKRLKETSALTIRSTFLGAHAVPQEFKNDKDGYLDLIINVMLPEIASEKLADYCDIFCERNYFSKEDAMRLFEAASKYGMLPKVHAEQLSHSGGIEAGVESKAISVDHIEFASDDDIRLLLDSPTMPTLLPGAQLFLGLQKPPVRKMISNGLPLAIASDFNPGSCPSGNMNQMISLACIMYGMTPSEVIIAATSNSAYAMGLSGSHGVIAVGKKANINITKEIPSFSFIPYYFGATLIETVILNGRIMKGDAF